MLKLSIVDGDLSGAWKRIGNRWECGTSWVEPYRHPMLEHVVFTDGRSVCLTVRERRAGTPVPAEPSAPEAMPTHAYREAVREQRAWPLDSLVLEIGAGELRIHAGRSPVAPVYLADGAGRVCGSWDMEDLRAFMRPDALNPRTAARLLSGHGRYAHETLFAGVHALTERSTATFGVRGLSLAYPEPVAQPLPRQLVEGADPVAAFEMMLERALALRPIMGERTAMQLSGGQDSATVALSLGALFPGRVTACAMMLPGEVGVQQERRRRALMEASRMAADVRIAALDLPPLSPGGRRVAGPGWSSPFEEPYLELLTALLGRLGAAGVHTVVTGFGGDELMIAPPGHRGPAADRFWLGPVAREMAVFRDEAIAPASAVPESTLMALSAVAPAMLRAGMWPVAPLAWEPLGRFAQWLPEEWRLDKRVMRERLARLGLPGEVARPVLRENFADVMATGLHRHGGGLLRRFADESYVVGAGLVDGSALRRVADRVAAGVPGAREVADVYPVVALELALRSLG
ncbi:hypothetical protein [Wenjunlia tyrosinilytica]|uniref:Asparagine synthase n=1 Tax=Wenjunlia tyrosinilytica TaxID=1544741 RepID=A0A917ZWW6_9ACTN|nr:hypothetical protein [Wenjunlia tyrosinilytica]GGO98111.1 hypothetical protein GCM10012280_61480 [Wenjunlia tyrosinilytica]